MNIKNLDKVFENYIEKFEWLNQKPEPDESYKWIAVKDFQKVFDMNVSDEKFARMLYDAWKVTANLIDSSQQQPFYALVEYARKEPKKVRLMFENLYADDRGDLTVRQAKIKAFLNEADELLQKYFPGSHRYINNQRSVMAYLWFYDPNTYYYYKATESKHLADCVEFYDDWGTYSDFKLDVYHRFCDELVERIKEHTALVETHKSRFEGNNNMHMDDNYHILIVDIIYCAKQYGLYNGIAIKDTSASAKRLYQERKEKAATLYKDVLDAEEKVELLKEATAVFTELIQNGAELKHKLFGKAEVVAFANGNVELYLPEKCMRKKFNLLHALASGTIRLDVPNSTTLIEKYSDVMRNEMSIMRKYESAVKALEPYKEYVD